MGFIGYPTSYLSFLSNKRSEQIRGGTVGASLSFPSLSNSKVLFNRAFFRMLVGSFQALESAGGWVFSVDVTPNIEQKPFQLS